MAKKKRTKVTRTANNKDINRSFATLLKFVDNMTEDEVNKMLGT